MRIAEFRAFRVLLPLKRQVKHASAARNASENIVVSCHLSDGTVGWGEGVPREYVTGESPQGVMRHLRSGDLCEQLVADCQSWPDVIALCESFQTDVPGDDRGNQMNSLRCAVELSVLDAFGRLLGEPLSSVVGHFEPAASVRTHADRVRYSAAIMAEGRRKEVVSAAKMRIYGFAQCKVKVGVAGANDAQRLRRIRRWLGRSMDLRLDANEAWRPDEVYARMEPLLRFNVTSIEQPVPHEEVKALAEVRRKLPVPIMLDESLTSLADAETAIRDGTCDLFNIRISKCGGFLRSLRLAAMAKAAGLRYQLGCHPGESGILSAAGRHWASAVENIRYLEGSYDRHLLAERLTREDITFGYGGWAPALQGAGLGVTVDAEAVERIALERVQIDFG